MSQHSIRSASEAFRARPSWRLPRSSALVVLLDNLLRAWCASGTLNDALATRITDGEPQFQGAVAKRNAQRQRTIWEPLEVLDGTFIDEERFAQF
jgi:hypothetical protein